MEPMDKVHILSLRITSPKSIFSAHLAYLPSCISYSFTSIFSLSATNI